MDILDAIELLRKYENETINGYPRYFFRGQTKDYDKITPSLARTPKNLKDNIETLRSQAHTICQLSREIANGIKGTISQIQSDDGLALMQHYGWLSPLIDVTGNLEVALFFAWLGYVPGDDAITYVFDREKLDAHLEIINHDFLLYNLDEGGLRHRFLRQDGYAITIRQRKDMQEILNFDLKKANCLIDSLKFQFPVNHRPGISDLLDETGDPLPRHLQSVMRNLVEEFFEGKICEHLSLLIDKMYVGEDVSIKDFKEVKEQLFKYGNRFTIDFLNDAITIVKSDGATDEKITLLKKQLDQIKAIRNWDLAVFASGDWILEKIQEFSTKKDEVKRLLVVAFNKHFEKAKLRHFVD